MPDGDPSIPTPSPVALAWERGWLGPLARGLHRVRGRFPSFGYWLGIFAAIYFWASVSFDVFLNRSWWVFGASSFSALGDAGPNNTSAAAGLYWIYNEVVIFPTAIMLMIFCSAMILAARNRIQTTAYSFFLVAAGFLFLVGVFHGETVNSAGLFCNPGCNGPPPYPPPYHDFVSDAFFFMADISFLLLSLGLIVERRFELGYLFLTMAVLTPLLVDGLDHPVTTGVIVAGVVIFLLFDLVVLGMYWSRAVVSRFARAYRGSARAYRFVRVKLLVPLHLVKARSHVGPPSAPSGATAEHAVDLKFALGYQFVLVALLIPLGLADALHNTSLSVAQNEAAAIIAIDLAAVLMFWARNPRRSA